MTTARRTFQSLRYRNYRLFFAGQLTSQIGAWMQRIALAWYVLDLTKSPAHPYGSPIAVGVMAFMQFLPFTLFGLFAGVITDRIDARRLVIATQVGQTLVAIVLAKMPASKGILDGYELEFLLLFSALTIAIMGGGTPSVGAMLGLSDDD